MKSVLVLGAGLVARPHVGYLLDHGIKVIVASRTVSKAEKIINDHKNGLAVKYNIAKDTDSSKLKLLMKDVNVVVSLLPYVFHVKVAKVCIELQKHLVTTSYVSDEMQALHDDAKKTNVILLNECGLDPGIDHLSAKQIIDQVHNDGGEIVSFSSYCGGLPSHPKANPYGYKLSWSPRGFLLAGTNSAKFLKDGKPVTIPGSELFANYQTIKVDGIQYEGYPNRNSVPYQQIYEIPEAEDIIRGTLRYGGHCDRFLKKAELGLLNDTKRNLQEMTFKDLIMDLIDSESEETLLKDVAEYLNLENEKNSIIRDYFWLGLFDDRPIPFDEGSPLDALEFLVKEKLQYAPGERDFVILHHTFIVEYADSSRKKITSTLLDYGIPNGDTSMSRTVGLPSAIAVRMILENQINLTGVQIPVTKDIYNPMLQELKELSISMIERIENL